MTITEEIRGLWRALVPAAQALGRAKSDTDEQPAKHRADTTRRPYAPVGRTGARIYRPPSHRAR
ncbi:MAG: hypothetical protein ACRDRA_12080 [Pseudonocardiaceae bacterium]